MFLKFTIGIHDYNLIQMVDFATRLRMVGPNLRSFILDHIYVKDPVIIRNLKSTRPYFGDHLVVEFCVKGTKNKPKT